MFLLKVCALHVVGIVLSDHHIVPPGVNAYTLPTAEFLMPIT